MEAGRCFEPSRTLPVPDVRFVPAHFTHRAHHGQCNQLLGRELWVLPPTTPSNFSAPGGLLAISWVRILDPRFGRTVYASTSSAASARTVSKNGRPTPGSVRQITVFADRSGAVLHFDLDLAHLLLVRADGHERVSPACTALLVRARFQREVVSALPAELPSRQSPRLQRAQEP